MNTQQPSYLSLIADHCFKESSAAKMAHHKQGDNIVLSSNERYIFVFVLQGQIDIYSNRGLETIKHGKLAILDIEQTVKCVCASDTALLEFTPPSRIEKFCKSACRIFGMSSSEQIPFNEQIDQWIVNLLTDLDQNKEINAYNYCCELSSILRKYPDIVLGTLYVTMNACSKRCSVCEELSKG